MKLRIVKCPLIKKVIKRKLIMIWLDIMWKFKIRLSYLTSGFLIIISVTKTRENHL